MSLGTSELTSEQSTTFFDDVVAIVMSRLPQVSAKVVANELTTVLDEFFREGRVWKDTLGPYTINADEEFFYLNPLDGIKKVLQVDYVLYNGMGIPPLASYAGIVPSEAKSPRAYTCPSPDVIRWIPIPTETVENGVFFTVTLKPEIPVPYQTLHYLSIKFLEHCKLGF